MIPQVRAELRKIFTIRSTYLILAFVLVLELFFGFYISGWRVRAADLLNPNTLAADITAALNAVAVFAALIAVLLVTHEYRYNTIMHTFTLSNSRSKVLAAKIIVMSGFAIVFTLIAGWLSPALASLGMHLHHLHLVKQTIDHSSLLWRGLFFGWGYTMAGLVLAILIRNQIGAIIALFIGPGVIESLLGLLLKKNVIYLPFTALQGVLGDSGENAALKAVNHSHSAIVFGIYLLAGLLVGWVLWLKRDAN